MSPRRALVATLLGAIALSCGDGEVALRPRVELVLPERVQCAAAPADIQAQLWISGMSKPCDLTVSSSGAVSGECPDITARIDRRATLDYYLMDPLSAPPVGVPTPYRLLLAQAVREVPLENPASDRVELAFGDADFVATSACRDMRRIDEETGEGAATVEDFAEGGTPCDVDADALGNLDELCATPATDPYAP